MKKLLFLSLAIMTLVTANAAGSAVSVPAATYSTTTDATKPGGGNKFMTMVANSLYSYRNTTYAFSNGKGLKTTGGNNSGYVFYIANPMIISASAQLYKDKTGGDITMTIYSITSTIFDKFLAGTDNNTKITDNMMETTATTFTIPIAATAVKGTFTGAMTSGLAAGYYYIVGTGGTSDLYLQSLTFASAGPSDDATLKALTYDGTPVSGFAASTTSYDVELSATYMGIPVVAATANNSKATASVTQPTAVPGTATVAVTAEDGTTKKTYTITFTKASNAPKVTSATWTNITAAGATVDNVGMTITGQVTNGTGLTSITPNFTGSNIQSWSPTTAQNFSAGAVDYTFQSSTSETTVYHVTITEAAPISNDATLKSLSVAGCTLSPAFSPATLTYQVSVSDGTVPQTTAVANHTAATVQVTPATTVAGVTKILVTAEDGITTKEYQITYKTVVPPSGLTAHQPGVYELSKAEGGYTGTLSLFGAREYEVYYIGRNSEDNATVQVLGAVADRVAGITKNEATSSCDAKDDWFKLVASGQKSAATTPTDEFTVANAGRCVTLIDGNSMKILVKGFDQFNLFGQDKKVDLSKPEKNQIFTVKIDGIAQTMTPSTEMSIRRFDMSSDEHLIEITGVNSCILAGFSLRCGTDPRVRYIMGNDSNQFIYQTRKLNPISYVVKNNVNTQVEWTSGTPATGISLVKHGSEGLKDTLMLEGNANCPVGIYTYRIVAYNTAGEEKSSIDFGTFTVGSLITATSDTIVTAYDGWSMDPIEFNYYALDASQIHLTWTGATPGGVSGAGTDGIYQITGTPTAQGTYPYTISVEGGNTLSGKLIVEHLELGNNPILYMYKGSTDQDGVLTHLKSKYSVMAATQTSVGNMSEAQKSKFKVIVISESTDANFEPALNLIRQSTIPVLNMQAFAYNPSRLGWGYASNGSATNGKITVQQPTHPVFKAMAAKAGQEINLLDSVVYRGLVNAEVNHTGSWCLATAAIRGEEYITDAEQQTFLHEVSATERGSKYLCLPIAKSSSLYLSTQGKRLIDECISYLMDGQKSPIALPTLQITRFAINNVTGVIDEANKIITVTMSRGDYSAVVPSITLADATTFVTPASGETVDFSDPFIAHDYVVCDYINKVTYKVYLKQPTALEDVYMPGEWVNVYNMQGMKIMTTNEDVHQLSLPRGVYIIQTSTQSFRIFK